MHGVKQGRLTIKLRRENQTGKRTAFKTLRATGSGAADQSWWPSSSTHQLPASTQTSTGRQSGRPSHHQNIYWRTSIQYYDMFFVASPMLRALNLATQVWPGHTVCLQLWKNRPHCPPLIINNAILQVVIRTYLMFSWLMIPRLFQAMRRLWCMCLLF